MYLKTLSSAVVSVAACATYCSLQAAATPLASREYNGQIRGVNLGGLFVLEPWITPSLFAPWANVTNAPVVDEWTYCSALGKDECTRRLNGHWNSWVQESDISQLASLGINTIRIPIGYWALSPDPSEPYIQGQVPYLKRVLVWAALHGLEVMLDLHGAPGSQNGFDNSGRRGDITWSQHPGDVQRTVDSLVELAKIANEFPSVKSIEALNEPANWGVPKPTIIEFYNKAYTSVRAVAPHVSLVFHDAFLPQEQWGDLVRAGWTNVYLDTHIYHVFDDGLLQLNDQQHVEKACSDGNRLAPFNYRTPTIVGEFSMATTDCAGWLNGFQRGARWDGTYLRGSPIVSGGSCAGQEDMSTWSPEKKAAVSRLARAQLQAYEKANGWVFWNFKTEASDAWNYIKLANAGIIPNPPVGWSFNECSN